MSALENHSATRELHLERALGKEVHDVRGQRVGRLEEVVAEQQGADIVVVEYHLGPAAALERIMDFAGGLPTLRILRRFSGERRAVPWRAMDLSDPDHPRITMQREDLARFRPGS